MLKVWLFRQIKVLQFAFGASFLCMVCAPAANAETTLKVLSSIRPLSLIVADIAPPEVEVDHLVPAWADPHSFQLKMSDMQRLNNADLVVWLGEDFERFLAKAISQNSQQQVLELTGLPNLNWPTLTDEDDEHAHHHSAEHGDPHLWLNPTNGIIIGEAVAQYLIAQLPQQKAAITSNLTKWKAAVQQQLNTSRQQLAPFAEISFAVSHDGYNHFVNAMGLHHQIAVAALPNQPLSAKKAAQLQKQVSNSACLITEVKTPQVERLAHVLGLPLIAVDPLAQNANTDTYLKLTIALTESFKQCLQAN